MRFKLTVLGTCSALPTISKYPTAHVLNVHEQFYLIDCGEGVQKQLKCCDINLLKINHIFVSHLHGDHVYGIFGLISSMGLFGRKRALEVFAPAPIKQIIDNHLRFFDRNLPFVVECHEVDTKISEVIYSNSVMEVITIPLKHSIPTVGYLFRELPPQLNIAKSVIDRYGFTIAQMAALKRGEDIVMSNGESIPNSDVTYLPYTPRKFAYCLDTAYSEKIIPIIEGVDLLMHEATYHAEDKKSAKKRFHSTTHDAATIATKANVKQLVITHFSTRYNTPITKFLDEAKYIFPATLLAREAMEIDIPLCRITR